MGWEPGIAHRFSYTTNCHHARRIGRLYSYYHNSGFGEREYRDIPSRRPCCLSLIFGVYLQDRRIPTGIGWSQRKMSATGASLVAI